MAEKEKVIKLGLACSDPVSKEVFIRILDILRQFRTTHWTLVYHYILEKSSSRQGTGGSQIANFIPNQLLTVLDFIIELSDDPNLSEDAKEYNSRAKDQRQLVLN